MSFLEAFVASPFAAAIGWAVLHSLLQGAAAAAGLAFVLAATRSTRIRYAAACAAMVVVFAAFIVTATRMAPQQATAAPIIRPPALNLEATPAASAPSVSISWAAAAPWLAPFWIAGVWIACFRHAAGWMALRRLRRRGVCCAADRWQREIGRLSAKLRVSRPVALLESCLADTPAAFGHFRPVILVPLGLLSGLAAEQVEAILLHELAHIRRRDYLVNIFGKVVEALLFYHPAIWWISAVIRAEREKCCDDLVVEAGADARQYAAALVEIAENRMPRGELVLAARGGDIVKRIHRLLFPQAKESAWAPLFAGLTLIATLATSLAAFQTRAVAQTSDSSPWMKWLNEDVAYIITDQERAAFLELTSDASREGFVEEFWLRRDPTPGTAENEFKQEHYRRIAYANEHFVTAFGTPGWRTDQGRIYIVYGPPDELEAHPAGPQRAYASRIWLYHHIDGAGNNVSVTFIDRTGSKDFRLAPGNGF